ncbi:hypothetical protein ACFQ8C_32925 [Streptomyces sp. NPDC056503]|uniref:hypothetical protein n=1 Tax=Streptomyces sp. NPDC056503 TaxID=3345842 RepID=UPI0036D1F6D3
MVSDEASGTAGAVGTDTGEAAVASGTAVLLAAAPAGRGRAMDAASVLPALAAVPPGVLTGTATATLVELADPIDPQTVLTRLRAAARGPGPLVVYLAGQLHLDRRQQLPHLALARSTTAALRYTALPWHWLAEAAAAGPTTVVADLVADPEAWARLTAGPELLRLNPTPALYARVTAPPRRGELLTPDYLRAWADQWRTGTRAPFPVLHEEAATRTRSPRSLFLAMDGRSVPVPVPVPVPAGVGAAVSAEGPSPAPVPEPVPRRDPERARPTPVPVHVPAPAPVPTPVPPQVPSGDPVPVPVPAKPPAPQPPTPPAPASAPAPAPGVAPAPAPGVAPAPAPASVPAPAPAVGPDLPLAGGGGQVAVATVPSLPEGFVPASAGGGPGRPVAAEPGEDGVAGGTVKLVPGKGRAAVPPVPPRPPVAPVVPAPAPVREPGDRSRTAAAGDAAGAVPGAVDPRRAGYGAAAPVAPAPHDPHPAILSAAMAGRHAEAAEMAAAWERDALRRFGPRSGEAVHWMEVRADLARLAGEPARSCELWLAVAEARLGLRQQPDDRDVEGAVDRAHHQWEQITDPARARALGPTLVALRRRVPGRRPGALEALRRRMHTR